MDLKFYLNKIIKVDNIEGYTLKYLFELKKRYDTFLDTTDGVDPDYPLLNFKGENGGKGKTNIKVKGDRNKIQLESKTEENT